MSSDKPILYGARYSVYVRVAIMALETKGVAYTLTPVDIFARGGPPEFYRALNPFNKIPTFVHDGFALFETVAINRYVDEAFEGPPLQPADVRQRARMMQMVSMADAYAYQALVWDIYAERISKPREGDASDEALISSAMPKARRYLAALHDLQAGTRYLVCDHPTLADCHAAPIFGYFLMTPEGRKLITEFPKLERWWSAMEAHPSWQAASQAE
jgi:glutathione S-transferase